MKALILAAGLGTRLMPYTEIRPKPLFTLGGIPVLKIIIDKLTQAGCTDIIINTHHLHEQIEKFINKTQFPVHIETRYEPVLLQTGGAIKNVRNFMRDSPFFVINSDIVSDIDLNKVWNFHLKGNWPATLVMHNHLKFNKVKINKEYFITKFFKTVPNIANTLTTAPIQMGYSMKSEHGMEAEYKSSNHEQILAFTGIQLLSPEIFRYMPLKNKFSSIDLYERLAETGTHVKAYICTDLYWNDIGTYDSYQKTCILHTAALCFNKEIETHSQNRIKNKNTSKIQDKTRNQDNRTSHYQNKNKNRNLKNLRIEQLKGDGSDRQWFRVKILGKPLHKYSVSGLKRLKSSHLELDNEQNLNFKSLIIADHGICSGRIKINTAVKNSGTSVVNAIDKKTTNTSEIDAFIAIGRHLFSIGIPVPEIYQYDLFSGMVAIEDLGNTHFQQIINELESEYEIMKWYEKICDYLMDFSIKGIKNFDTSWAFQTKEYTMQLIIEKECRYFIDAFIRGYLKKKAEFYNLKETFEFIAENALKYSFTGLMHRDLQSRNIMVKNEQIFFIDFQAARKGPLQYDLASLLIDPYVNLNPEIREKILMYCALKINRLTGFNKDKFIQGFRFCSITRNMQILGAFSYLSMVKGKKFFKNYIPCALKNLKINIDILNHETNGRLEPVKNLLNVN